MLKVGITSLGCPRNLVDSEVMLGYFKKEGFVVSDVDEGVDIFIINTCSFIESAREESIDVILEAIQLKKEGKIKRLVVAGCLPQLHKEKLQEALPDLDLILGTNDFPRIINYIKKIDNKKEKTYISQISEYLYDEYSPRMLLSPAHYAYVKISEGCDNFCSYCIISRLRGKLRSRRIESVVKEIEDISSGAAVKEINLIGQDTTRFGEDIYGKPMLSELLKNIARLKNDVTWIRILYTHPAHYTDELISLVGSEERICKYLDMPIQHISDNILKNMNRPTAKKDIIKLIRRLRREIPGVFLRTSLIVGFPGESDNDFNELMDFVREMRFERLGVFTYSREEGTPAYNLSGQVPEDVKLRRFDEIMRAQQDIARDINKTFLGKDITVLIDEKIEGEKDKFFGRTSHDAPEVDGGVYVTGKNVKTGEFTEVKITDTLEYDLVGEAI